MSDDKDVQNKRTRRMDAVGNRDDDEEQAASGWGLEEESSQTVEVNRQNERKTVREVPIGKADEPTAVIDRNELMQHTSRDQERGQNRHQKQTVRMDTPIGAEHNESGASSLEETSAVDKTHEMDITEHTTRPVIPTDHDALTIDSTDEFARHGIVTVEDDDKISFPARIDGDLRIVIPPELGLEAEIEPGDLVLVELRKVK